MAGAVVLGFCGWLLASWPPEPPQSVSRLSPSAPEATPEVVDAVIVGDSHYAGNGGLPPTEAPSIAERVAAGMGWQATLYTVGGTGFIATGYDGDEPVFGEHVPDIIAARPDVVLIEGGGNDTRYGAARVEDAATRILAELRDGLPRADIYLLGPLYTGHSPEGEPIAAALAAAAEAADVVHIDPDGWFPGEFYAEDGPNRRFVGDDLVHVNERGADRLVRRSVAALRKAGAPTG